MDSQYRSLGRRDLSGPPRRERTAPERFLLAFLVAAYALTALAAPFAHALEVKEGAPGVVVAQGLSGAWGVTVTPGSATPPDSGSGSVGPAATPATLPAPAPFGGDDPFHGDLDCLTCAFLALSGAPGSADAERDLSGTRSAPAFADAPVHPGTALPTPNSRGPPAAA